MFINKNSTIAVAIATPSSVYVTSETRVISAMYDMMKILLGGYRVFALT